VDDENHDDREDETTDIAVETPTIEVVEEFSELHTHVDDEFELE
jgi:hypothetical protein